MSPRHHGQGSTSPGEPAGEVRRPRTFSITTRQGRRAATARATCSQSPERVWALSPARRPATETSLTGEAGRQDAHPGDGGPVDGGDIAQVRDAGPGCRRARTARPGRGRRTPSRETRSTGPRGSGPRRVGPARARRWGRSRRVPGAEERLVGRGSHGWPREGGRAIDSVGSRLAGAGGDAPGRGVLRARAALTRLGGGSPVGATGAVAFGAGLLVAVAQRVRTSSRGPSACRAWLISRPGPRTSS